MKQEYLDMVQGLADKLGTTAEHLWDVLVTQAPITAAWELFFTVAVLVLAAFLGKLVYMADLSNDDAMAAWVGVGILGLLCLIVVAINGESILAGLFNPEYWALMQLIR